MPVKKGGWIQEVDKEMKKDKTTGAFTKQAKAKGKSVKAYAAEVVKKYKGKKMTKAQETLFDRAVLAQTFERLAKKRKAKKDKKVKK